MEKINFNAEDGINLNGLLYKTKEKSQKVILAIHGMGSNCFKNRDEIIAKKANENNIDYMCFNNRGSDLVRYIYKYTDGKRKKMLGGTTYEDVLESYYDIIGAIKILKELGYQKIYLQGHSLGSTKVVYTYNKMKSENNDLLKNIEGIILLSLIDIPFAIKFYLRNDFKKYFELAENLEKDDKILKLMPEEAFVHPISVKTFLRYVRDNKEIDFAKYGEDKKLEKINNIEVPLFMRWGNENEMIIQKAQDLINMLNEIIKNQNKDIDYINGADHGYTNKEEILADQIIKFIYNIQK